MSAITRISIRRPVFVTMAFAAVALLGAVGATRLPVTELPKVDFPAVTITVSDLGSNSQTVEQNVTTPIEQSLAQVSGISEIDGTSGPGVSQVVVQLDSGVDVDSAANDISQAVGSIGRKLPSGASTPTITKTNPYATPLLTVDFSGQAPQQLYDTVTAIAEPRLQLADGVGQITLAGGVATNADVQLNPTLLESRGITIAEVDQALTTSSSDVAAGSVDSGSQDTQVVTKSATGSVSALSGIVVGNDDGAPVTLGEVATVTEAPAAPLNTSELNGKPTVSLTITAQDGANEIATDDAVKAALGALQNQLPSGVTATVTSDTSVFTRAALTATAQDLVLAVILASLVILLFLQSAKETLIVLVAIPTSLLTTLLAMYVLHFSLDVISLLAFSLLIGILVDDAIVVLESISRHLAAGQDPESAAYNGRNAIGAAAVALTLTDVVVFLPVVFASGVTGQILLEFGVIITIASLVSLCVSFTLTPMLAAKLLKPRPAEEYPTHGRPRRRIAGALEAGVSGLTRGYERLLRSSLRVRPMVLIAGAAAAAISVLLVTTQRLPSTYAPSEDTGLVNVTAVMPSGTTIGATDAALQQLADLVHAQIAGVTNISTSASSIGAGSMTVDLVDKTERPESAAAAAQSISRLALTIPGMRAAATVPNALVPPNGNGLQIVLRGPDPQTVTQLATTVSEPLGRLPQLGQVLDTASATSAGYDIQVNQAEAASLGVTQQQVADTLATAIGGTQAGYIQTSQGVEEAIEIQLADPNLTEQQLLNLPVATTAARAASGASPNAAAAPVTLGQVATVSPGSAPYTINDYDQLPEATIRTTLAANSTSSAAVSAIQKTLAGVTFPPGYDYVITGENQQQASAFAPLETALELSPLLVYMLLAALYESLLIPLCVILAVPLATAGAFCTLVWANQTLNLFSLIGLLMLIGLVSKNAILLVDHAERLRRSGVPRTQAVVEAGRIRLRPIIMTTLTVVIAMLPIALIDSAGSEDRAPMAFVLIGGMTGSTLLTLLVVPTLYTYLDALRERLRPSRIETLRRDAWKNRSRTSLPDSEALHIPVP